MSCPTWEDELAGMAADSADGMTLIIRTMNEQIDRLSERIAENPRYGYLIAGGILLLWLVGVICGWKWTYEPNRWGWHWLRDTFGEGAVRFCVGALLVVALAGVTCLYFATG